MCRLGGTAATCSDNGGVALAKADLERIDQPLANVCGGGKPVDQDKGIVKIVERVIFGLLQFDHLAAAIQPRKSLLEQRDQECRCAQIGGF